MILSIYLFSRCAAACALRAPPFFPLFLPLFFITKRECGVAAPRLTPHSCSRIYGIYDSIFTLKRGGKEGDTKTHTQIMSKLESHSCIMGQYQRVEIRYGSQSFITLIASFKSGFLHDSSVSKHTEVCKVEYIYLGFTAHTSVAIR